MTLVCCGWPHPHGGSTKVWGQQVIFILKKVIFNIQPNTRALSQWATTTATSMVALVMALVVLVAWVMAIVPAMVVEAMVVMAVATSVLLSMEDTGHLDFTESILHLQWSVSPIQNPPHRLPIFTPAMLLTWSFLLHPSCDISGSIFQ